MDQTMSPRNRRNPRPLAVLLRLVPAQLALALLISCAADKPAPPPPADLEGRIRALRREEKDDEARVEAVRLLRMRQADRSTRPYEIADAERLIQTIETFQLLPPDVRHQLVEADRRDPRIDSLAARGEYRKCVVEAEAQLEIRSKYLGREHLEVAASLMTMAIHLANIGDLAAAEPAFREILAIRRRLLGTTHPGIAQALNNLGSVMLLSGDPTGAEPLFLEALDMWSALGMKNHFQTARTLANLASARMGLDDPAGAEQFARRALAMTKKQSDPRMKEVAFKTLVLLADIEESRGEYKQSIASLRESLSLQHALLGAEHPITGQTLTRLAPLLGRTGRVEEADALLNESLKMEREYLGEEHPLIASTLTEMARVRAAQGDDAGALCELERAAAVFEAARCRVRKGLAQARFHQSPYPLMAVEQLKVGQAAEAWSSTEKIQGRILADLLQSSERRSLSADESARERYLRELMPELEAALFTYRDQAGQDSSREIHSRIEETRNRLLDTEAEWGRFQQSMADKYPVSAGRPFPLERVQASLSGKTALVGWVHEEDPAGGRVSWGYVVRSSGPVRWVRLDHASPSEQGKDQADSLREDARAYRQALAATVSRLPASDSTEQLTTLARRLSAYWIAPLASHLADVEYLIVVPSGPLRGIPIEAFSDSTGVYIGDRYTVAYAPSATVYAWLQEQSRVHRVPAPRTALLIGDPPFRPEDVEVMRREDGVAPRGNGKTTGILAHDGSPGGLESRGRYTRIQGTRDEIIGIASVLPGATCLLGAAASEQSLVGLARADRLRGFDTIHFATHAMADNVHPERSCLVLSQVELPDPMDAAKKGEQLYDGLIGVKEILSDWKLDADLVTLSACQTACGEEMPGEGTIGLARAFFQVGARSLVVSLWKVEDHATALTMRRFYENLSGRYGDRRARRIGVPLSKAEALREAKTWLRDYEDSPGHHPYRHPAFWSVFILMGDPGQEPGAGPTGAAQTPARGGP
jgi:CHAT domain-containing protein